MIEAEGNTLKINPYFVEPGSQPEDDIEWVETEAVIKKANGDIVFQQQELEFPRFWSQNSINITAEKYFRIIDGKKERSLKEMVRRVTGTIARWGQEQGYFDEENQKQFENELAYMIYNQIYSFNSPVWFNVGVKSKPQCAACFIQSIEDNMASIMGLATSEAFVFKGGSGTGTNFSPLRSRGEPLSTGGWSSGSVSFMKALDSMAGQIKSGGATRRAAKMAILDSDHPDIEEFIGSKVQEEKKALALIEGGFNPNFEIDNGAYSSVAFQNENHSVMVSDAFMEAVEEDEEWSLRNVLDGTVARTVSARGLFKQMAEAAWMCGDPGIQFSDTMNKFHTTPKSGKIRGSNPCGEHLDVPDSACNLGSLNPMRFIGRDTDGFSFDSDAFCHAVSIATLAQDIVVDKSSYPTEKIEKNAKTHRQLGIGYTNLGNVLMYCGYPYDSRRGRALASVMASMLTASAWYTSSQISAATRPFIEYNANKEAVLRVMAELRSALLMEDVFDVRPLREMKEMTSNIWADLLTETEEHGVRNSRVTLMAPTGTISFMMGCDTTGVEPDISLVKVKTMVGGGSMKMINTNIVHALRNLGYIESNISKIIQYVKDKETVEGCTELKEEHLKVFDCAMAGGGTRSISPMGHLKMMAAIQAHINAGISKTVNLPEHATARDIENLYMDAHKMGIKSITVYRDGSKTTQPLNTKKKEAKERQTRRVLPNDVETDRHKFKIGGQTGYLHVGKYEDGTVGEIFIQMSKAGSTMSGLLNCFSIAVSLAIQHGTPLEVICTKFQWVQFDPRGMTKHPTIKFAESVIDYVFKYLARRYLSPTDVKEERPVPNSGTMVAEVGVACATCGSMMVRSGSCFICQKCGESSGCS